MPVPNAAQIKANHYGNFEGSLDTNEAMKVAGGVAEVLGDACRVFVERVMLAPGVPCSVNPQTQTGHTVAGTTTMTSEQLT